jgi:hypothetical protein
LARFGITASHVEQAGCYAYDLAAWRLRMHTNDKGDLWTKAANYTQPRLTLMQRTGRI